MFHIVLSFIETLPTRQGKEKAAAFAQTALNLDLPAVELDNPGGNGKAKAGVPVVFPA